MSSGSRNAILFKGADVVSMDKNIGVRKNCDVLVQNDTIVKVEPNIEAPGAEVIDARNCIISPGFIDGHHHMWQQLLRSIATDWSLADYLVVIRRCYGSLFTAEDVYAANHVAALDLIYNGVTTVVDHCHILNSPAHTDAAIKALKDSLIRGVFCYGFYENPQLPSEHNKFDVTNSEFRVAAKTEDARRARKEHWKTNSWETDLLTFGLAPAEAETMGIDNLRQQIALGRELGSTIITAHVALGQYDPGNQIVRQLGESKTLGKDLLFSHGSSFTTEECEYLAKSKAGVISTPETELQMGMGRPVAFKAEGHGCHVGLGIDITSNNANDMFNQMRLLLQAERARNNEELGAIPVSIKRRSLEALRMGTLGGAEALGIDHLVGSITPGKRADLIMVRCDDINVVPAVDPVGVLMFNANASNIDLTMINGTILKKNGKLVHADWSKLREEVRARTQRLVGAAETILGDKNAGDESTMAEFTKMMSAP
jgi:cytosine/adenosine deaminase-related metal-dependent hydrolase